MARSPKSKPVVVAAPPSKPTDRHRLAGLEPDNLLAFLALLGLLRALDAARPDWRARAYFDPGTPPLRPVLTLGAPETEEAIAEAAAEGVRYWGQFLEPLCAKAIETQCERLKGVISDLSGKIDDKSKKARSKAENKLSKLSRAEGANAITDLCGEVRELSAFESNAALEEQAWLACLGGMRVFTDDLPQVSSGPMKFTSGQMAYVGTIRKLVRGPKASEIGQSLFRPWLFKHRGDSLRFAPAEARRYALSAHDPTEKQPETAKDVTGKGVAPSERGANSLAALGLLSVPVHHRLRRAAATLFSSRDDDSFSWPLWGHGSGRGARLSGIEALLKIMPEFTREKRDSPSYGVMSLMEAGRVQVTDQGDYYNVEAAREIAVRSGRQLR